MKERFVSLRFSEPLYIGDVKPKSSFLVTKDYIPGALVRGALAEWLINKGREREISGLVKRIRFGNLFPSNGDTPSLPLPMTAVSCKSNPGFASSPNAHGICDLLIPQLAYLELERAGEGFPVPFAPACRRCFDRLEKCRGFYFKDGRRFREVKLERVSQTKVALSRRRGVAQEGMLYHVTALRPERADQPIFFAGRVWVQGEEDFKLLLEALNESSLGGLTTRGYGKVEEAKPLEWSWGQVEDRLRRFNEALEKVWGELSSGRKEPEHVYFTIDLLSPAVLKDPYGLPTLKLDPGELGLEAELAHWVVRPGYASGWSTAWGLPKGSALTAVEGSSFVYRTRKNPKEVASLLGGLEERGVGERVCEGFGEIIVCHPFHMEVNPV